MKLPFLCAPLAVMLAVNPAKADLTIVQKSDSPGAKGSTTMKVKGTHVRIDAGDSNSVIVDTKSGETRTLDHAQKQVTVGSLHSGAGAETLRAAMASAKSSRPKATGAVEKLGEYDCDVYEWDFSGMKNKLWVARNYPQYDVIKTELGVLSQLGNAPTVADLPGMVIQSKMNLGGTKLSTVLESVKLDLLPEEDFMPPRDYELVETAKKK